MKKNKLYLDFNVLIYLKDNKDEELQTAINLFLEKGYYIVFSPAHIEEIAVAEKRDNQSQDIINKDLEFISKLTNNKGLRRISINSCALWEESPKECYRRVVQDYTINDYAEFYEKLSLENAHINPISEPKEMNNIKPEDILKDIKHKRIILNTLVNNEIIEKKQIKKAIKWKFEDIRSKFFIVEAYIENASKYLEQLGFYRENKKNYRSKLHDTSHIIYSSYCEVFITNDKKLYKKTKAIYALLKIKTKVYMKDNFIKMTLEQE